MPGAGDPTDHTHKANHPRVRERLEIEAIARDLQRPIAEVAEIYAELDSALRARAQVTDYLPVLVARKVRARYRGPGDASPGA